jgi:hypothetical protein
MPKKLLVMAMKMSAQVIMMIAHAVITASTTVQKVMMFSMVVKEVSSDIGMLSP